MCNFAVRIMHRAVRVHRLFYLATVDLPAELNPSDTFGMNCNAVCERDLTTGIKNLGESLPGAVIVVTTANIIRVVERDFQ